VNDFLLDTNFDLFWQDGDLATGDCDLQNQQLLLLIEKGELREFPMRGVGSQSWLLDDRQFGDYNGAVKREFEADGMTVRSLSGTGFDLKIDATYE
jgi:hypothetical protein